MDKRGERKRGTVIMIKFVLMVNKQGQTRLASYFHWYPIHERVALEAEIIRRYDYYCKSWVELIEHRIGPQVLKHMHCNPKCITLLSWSLEATPDN